MCLGNQEWVIFSWPVGHLHDNRNLVWKGSWAIFRGALCSREKIHLMLYNSVSQPWHYGYFKADNSLL